MRTECSATRKTRTVEIYAAGFRRLARGAASSRFGPSRYRQPRAGRRFSHRARGAVRHPPARRRVGPGAAGCAGAPNARPVVGHSTHQPRPGPVLPGARGRDGRPFTMYKFRTMRVDAEAAGEPVWAKRGDPRRTTLGILLRRLSLDELPQLVNVLQGDMSLVGPRPERPYFVERFAGILPEYDERHQVPPGITGWAQINGLRGDSSIEKRLEYDLAYVRRRSLWFNLHILLLTPLRALIERNAN